MKDRSKSLLKKLFTGILVGTCVMAMAAPAFANTEADYGTGAYEVDNVESQETTFNAYKIFDANVNEDGTLSNFAWPSTAVQNAVINAIKTFTGTYSSTNAQDAADYISSAYQNATGQLTTDNTTILANQELLNKIAAAVNDTADKVSFSAGTEKTFSEGYWLIVTDGASVGTDEDGTSPIFAVVSGGKVTINEKTSIPTVDKLVKNDADGADWTYGAEGERGQSMQHKVTGTVACNIKTYGSYYYEFEDVMSAGIDYDPGSFKVTLDGTDVTASFTQDYKTNADGTRTLSIKCSDILEISGVAVNGDSELVLTYTTKLNDNCVIGSAGNPNDVRIIYSSNPNTTEKSSTHTVRDYLYTYRLHVEKKDRDTNVSLAGAKFTIKATSPDDTASKDLYVQADGRLGSTAYEFTTDEDGVFEVSGLDAGTYTVHETQAPDGYAFVNEDTLVTIAATYNEDGTVKTLGCTVSENADACAGTDSTDDNTVNGDEGTAAIVAQGLVNMTIGNIEKVRMPLSGQEGTTGLIIGGTLVVMMSAGGLVLASRKRKTSAQ